MAASGKWEFCAGWFFLGLNCASGSQSFLFFSNFFFLDLRSLVYEVVSRLLRGGNTRGGGSLGFSCYFVTRINRSLWQLGSIAAVNDSVASTF